ncbi:MAG TPA: hypothetical protein PLS81_08530 [Deltaproteobacteria bacterium]|nr:hypothetical protein [Deltaproteobacteria bacterium]HOM29489.1 hypothetical protein [Deltaproteobacteria bacterium]HPP80271.1 hypothetical protein [Deltaproteobacteria bacterium]
MTRPRLDRRPKGALEALLSSTLFKDVLRTALNSADPARGAEAVNTMLGRDPEAAFALVSSIPAAVNTLVSALTELALRLGNYPPALAGSMASAIARDVNKDVVRACAAAWKGLARGVLASRPDLAAHLLVTVGVRVKAGALNALARFINDVHRHDPGVLSAFFAEVLRRVDGDQARKACLALANAFLDQRWGIPSFAAELLATRARRSIERLLGKASGKAMGHEG